MTRFYIEGDEIDVQDPMFFIQTEHLLATKEAIDDFIEDYVR